MFLLVAASRTNWRRRAPIGALALPLVLTAACAGASPTTTPDAVCGVTAETSEAFPYSSVDVGASNGSVSTVISLNFLQCSPAGVEGDGSDVTCSFSYSGNGCVSGASCSASGLSIDCDLSFDSVGMASSASCTCEAAEEVESGPADTRAPEIEHEQVESPVSAEDGVTICADVTDDTGVSSATVYVYSAGMPAWLQSAMELEAGDTYCDSLGGIYLGNAAGEVEYYIEAKDSAGNVAWAPDLGAQSPYSFTVVQ